MKKPQVSMFPGKQRFLSPEDRHRIADAILVRYGESLEHRDLGKAASVLAAKELNRSCLWESDPSGGITTTCHGRLPEADADVWSALITDPTTVSPELRYCAYCGGYLITRGFDLQTAEEQE